MKFDEKGNDSEDYAGISECIVTFSCVEFPVNRTLQPFVGSTVPNHPTSILQLLAEVYNNYP